MPFISTKTNVSISASQEEKLRAKFGEAIELVPGKTEKWLMLQFEGQAHMAFAGSAEACAMVRVICYGKASSEAYAQLTKALTQLISDELSIDPSRIYVAYSETDHWGWAGNNF